MLPPNDDPGHPYYFVKGIFPNITTVKKYTPEEGVYGEMLFVF